MSLANRLTIYILVALAVILAGFSTTMYFLASAYLHAGADLKLRTTLETLTASTEVFPDHVEWEPELRRIPIGQDPSSDQVRWIATAPDGKVIDRSANMEVTVPADLDGRGTWRTAARRVSAGRFEPEAVEAQPIARDALSASLPVDRGYKGSGLVLRAAISEAPIRETLLELVWALAGVSLATWVLTAALGRWLCRRALSPVLRMAASARAIQRSKSPEHLLDVSPSGDELECLGQAFNDVLATLRRSLDRQQNFAGEASHQLRTPLAALITSVDVTLRHERSPDEYRRVLEVVRRRAAQLRQIVESLLFLARAGDSADVRDMEVFNLGEWVKHHLSGWADHARAADVTLEVEGGDLKILADRGLVGQVVDTLLDNACAYSEPGTAIIVRVEQSHPGVTLSVIDRGRGIAAGDVPLVFEPFYRSADVRSSGKPGVGLGLSIVRRIVTLLGAQVSLKSVVGEGSEFRVSFPAVENIRRGA